MNISDFEEKYGSLIFNSTTSESVLRSLLDDVENVQSSFENEFNIDLLSKSKKILDNYNAEIMAKTIFDDKWLAKEILDKASSKALRRSVQLTNDMLEKKQKEDMIFIADQLNKIDNNSRK